MLTRRIIPCLDVRDGRVVKGVRFGDLRDIGDPATLAARYAEVGADEITFLDVAASLDGHAPLLELVEAVGRVLFIPFTVGGGIRTVNDAVALLRAGADKVALSSAAVERPSLISELAERFGRQCVVLSVDTRRIDGAWRVATRSATRNSPRECLDWIREGVDRGAGEILLNVIDTDGTREGFEIDLTREAAETVSVPLIASGGAGSASDFVTVFRETAASAALAAGLFHDGTETPASIKHVLKEKGIEVRP